MAWIGKHWRYYRELTINSSEVSVDETGMLVRYDLANLPTSFFTNCGGSADSIRLTLANGSTLIPHWVDYYNASTEDGILYFLADVLASTDVVVRMYYCNPFAAALDPTDPNGRHAVFTNYAGYWPFNENADDATVNANHGTATNGAALQISNIGQEYIFDGSNDYVNVPHHASLSSGTPTKIVMELLWTPDLTDGDGWSGIFAKRGAANTNYGLSANPDTGTDTFSLYFQNTTGFFSATVTVSGNFVNGTEYHIVGTLEDVGADIQLELYIDGVGVASNTVLGENILTSGDRLTIGATYFGSYGEWMDCAIDEPSVRFDKILGAQEVINLYNNISDTNAFITSGSEVTRASEGTFIEPKETWESEFHGYNRDKTPSDWINGWSSNTVDPEVISDALATNGAKLRWINSGSNGERWLRYTGIPKTYGGARTQMRFGYKTSGTTNGNFRMIFRGSGDGTDTGKNAICFYIDSGQIGFFHFVNDSFAFIGAAHLHTLVANTQYHIVADVSGHSDSTAIVCRAKIWTGDRITDEPVSWQINVNETEALNDGEVGVGRFGVAETWEIDYMNVAVDTDALHEFPGWEALATASGSYPQRKVYRPIQSSEVGGAGGTLPVERFLLQAVQMPNEAKTTGDTNEATAGEVFLTEDSEGKIRLPGFTVYLENDAVPADSKWSVPYKVYEVEQDNPTPLYIWYNWTGNAVSVDPVSEFGQYNVSEKEYEVSLPMNEDPDGGVTDVIKDITENQRHATPDSTMTTADQVFIEDEIRGIDFDGSNDWLAGGSWETADSTLTLFGLVEKDGSSRDAWIGNHDATDRNLILALAGDGNDAECFVDNVFGDFGPAIHYTTAQVTTLCYVFKDNGNVTTSVSLYFDGVLQNTILVSGDIPNTLLDSVRGWSYFQEYNPTNNESDHWDGKGAWLNIISGEWSVERILTQHNNLRSPADFHDTIGLPGGAGVTPELPIPADAFLTARLFRFSGTSVTSTTDLVIDKSSFGVVNQKLESNATKFVYSNMGISTFQLDEGFFGDFSSAVYYMIEVQFGTVWDAASSRTVFYGVVDRNSIWYDKPTKKTRFQCLSIDKMLNLSPKISPRGKAQIILTTGPVQDDLVVQRTAKTINDDQFDFTFNDDKIIVAGDLGSFWLSMILNGFLSPGALMTFEISYDDNLGEASYSALLIDDELSGTFNTVHNMKTSLFSDDRGDETFSTLKRHYLASDHPMAIDQTLTNFSVTVTNIKLQRNIETYIGGIFTIYVPVAAGPPATFNHHNYKIDAVEYVDDGVIFTLNDTVGTPADPAGLAAASYDYAIMQKVDFTDSDGQMEIKMYSSYIYSNITTVPNTETGWEDARYIDLETLLTDMFALVPVLQHLNTSVNILGTPAKITRMTTLSDEPDKAFSEIQRQSETLIEFDVGNRLANGLRQLQLNVYTREYLATQVTQPITVPLILSQREVADYPTTVVKGGDVVNRIAKKPEAYGWYSVDTANQPTFTQFADDIPNNSSVINIDKPNQNPQDAAYFDGGLKDFYYNDVGLRLAAQRMHDFYSIWNLPVTFDLQGVYDYNLGAIVSDAFQERDFLVLGTSIDYNTRHTKVTARAKFNAFVPAIYFVSDYDFFYNMKEDFTEETNTNLDLSLYSIIDICQDKVTRLIWALSTTGAVYKWSPYGTNFEFVFNSGFSDLNRIEIRESAQQIVLSKHTFALFNDRTYIYTMAGASVANWENRKGSGILSPVYHVEGLYGYIPSGSGVAGATRMNLTDGVTENLQFSPGVVGSGGLAVRASPLTGWRVGGSALYQLDLSTVDNVVDAPVVAGGFPSGTGTAFMDYFKQSGGDEYLLYGNGTGQISSWKVGDALPVSNRTTANAVCFATRKDD